MGEVRVVVVVERELKWRRAVSQYCGRLGMHFCQARMRSVHKDVTLQLAYVYHCGRMDPCWGEAHILNVGANQPLPSVVCGRLPTLDEMPAG